MFKYKTLRLASNSVDLPQRVRAGGTAVVLCVFVSFVTVQVMGDVMMVMVIVIGPGSRSCVTRWTGI